ncbi:MAG: ABC transporter permease [Chloroflexi bacterium]|nr:ABC transporter permease [Chloroflexota bacterium]
MAVFEWRQTGQAVSPPPDGHAARWWHWRNLLLPASGVVAVMIWELVIRLGNYPAFILPPPGRVLARGLIVAADGTLWRHTRVTLSEILLGLALGLIVAWGLGYLLAKSRTLERALSPYIVASQSVPIVAIAPLLVIWFGSEITSKVLICALIVFFPVLINTIVGIRSVEPELRDLMRSLKATRGQTFLKLEVPAALPALLGGLKIGATLSVIGAVVGEFVGADAGLGFLINAGRGLYDTALMFVAIFVLVAIALSLYGLVALLERWLLAWRR